MTTGEIPLGADRTSDDGEGHAAAGSHPGRTGVAPTGAGRPEIALTTANRHGRGEFSPTNAAHLDRPEAATRPSRPRRAAATTGSANHSSPALFAAAQIPPANAGRPDWAEATPTGASRPGRATAMTGSASHPGPTRLAPTTSPTGASRPDYTTGTRPFGAVVPARSTP